MRPRENPFNVQRTDRLDFRPSGWSWNDLMLRLKSNNNRGAIIGPHGSGKTTLVNTLEPKLAETGYDVRQILLNESHPQFDRGVLCEMNSSHFVILDGAERLSRFQWSRVRRLARNAGGLLVTSHRPGLLPTLVTCTTSVKLLHDILDDLLLDKDGVKARQHAEELFILHQGNIRNVLRAMYDIYSS